MKTFLVLFLALTCSSFAQGEIIFNTRRTGQVDAPVMREDGIGIGVLYPDARAQLYLVSGTGSSTTYTPLFPIATFYNTPASPVAARYIIIPQSNVVVPGTLFGQEVTVVMRVWAGGPTYETATLQQLQSNPVTVRLMSQIGPPLNDGYLVGLQPIIFPIPEPATLAFLLIGSTILQLAAPLRKVPARHSNPNSLPPRLSSQP